MKKLAIAFLSATLLTTAVYADDNTVVATYIDGNVTEKQVMDQFGPILNQQPENKNKKFSELDKNLKEMLVRGYVNTKLFDKEADSLGIRNSQGFKDKMKAVETQLVQQELVERYVKDKITDAMLEDEYKKLVANLKGKEEIKTSHILVDSEEKAKEIKKKLNKGAKFADLVKEFSQDEGSKANGGDIGYTVQGQLVPEYDKVAFAMKKNEISEPVKSQFGWHIIKLVDKRPAAVPSKEEAIQALRAKLSRELVEKYFNDLAAAGKVELKI